MCSGCCRLEQRFGYDVVPHNIDGAATSGKGEFMGKEWQGNG
jgi:hypothetical protein